MLLDERPETKQGLENLTKITPEPKYVRPGSEKLLLVEDDPSNILIESIFLDQCGYSYDVASSGREVLKKVTTTSYALILMNINLPDMNGLAVTRELREMERQGLINHMPIIAVTAYALTGYRDECLKAGMNGYISKPFTQKQLCEQIERSVKR